MPAVKFRMEGLRGYLHDDSTNVPLTLLEVRDGEHMGLYLVGTIEAYEITSYADRSLREAWGMPVKHERYMALKHILEERGEAPDQLKSRRTSTNTDLLPEELDRKA